MDNTADTNSFIGDLRTLAGKTDEILYERDWTIFAARKIERETITDIAAAIGLSRSQVHRIMGTVQAAVDSAVDLGLFADEDAVIDDAWTHRTWAGWSDR